MNVRRSTGEADSTWTLLEPVCTENSILIDYVTETPSVPKTSSVLIW